MNRLHLNWISSHRINQLMLINNKASKRIERVGKNPALSTFYLSLQKGELPVMKKVWAGITAILIIGLVVMMVSLFYISPSASTNLYMSVYKGVLMTAWIVFASLFNLCDVVEDFIETRKFRK